MLYFDNALNDEKYLLRNMAVYYAYNRLVDALNNTYWTNNTIYVSSSGTRTGSVQGGDGKDKGKVIVYIPYDTPQMYFYDICVKLLSIAIAYDNDREVDEEELSPYYDSVIAMRKEISALFVDMPNGETDEQSTKKKTSEGSILKG